MKTVERVLDPGWLERVLAQPAAPDQATIVDLALKFAHTGTLRDWLAVTSIAVNPGMPLPPTGDTAPLQSGEQHHFRLALAAIVKGKGRVAKAEEESWIAAKNGVLPIETTVGAGATRRAELRYVQISTRVPFDGMFAVVLVWLLKGGPFGGRLCQCHYSKCQRFFLAEPPGRRGRWRTMYCPKPRDPTQDHMRLAHNERKKPGKPRHKRRR